MRENEYDECVSDRFVITLITFIKLKYKYNNGTIDADIFVKHYSTFKLAFK